MTYSKAGRKCKDGTCLFSLSLESLALGFFHWKCWLQSFASTVSLRVSHDDSVETLYVTLSEFSIALWVLWMQALLTFKARCFGGPIPHVEVLKVGTRDGTLNPLLLREKLGVVSSFPVVCHWIRGRVDGDSVSAFPTYFPASCFLICPVYRNHSVSRFCSQEIVSYVAVDLVCPRRRWVRDLPMWLSWTRTKWSFVCLKH